MSRKELEEIHAIKITDIIRLNIRGHGLASIEI